MNRDVRNVLLMLDTPHPRVVVLILDLIYWFTPLVLWAICCYVSYFAAFVTGSFADFNSGFGAIFCGMFFAATVYALPFAFASISRVSSSVGHTTSKLFHECYKLLL